MHKHTLTTQDLQAIRAICAAKGYRTYTKEINLRVGLDGAMVNEVDANTALFDEDGHDLHDVIPIQNMRGETIRIDESGKVALDVVVSRNDRDFRSIADYVYPSGSLRLDGNKTSIEWHGLPSDYDAQREAKKQRDREQREAKRVLTAAVIDIANECASVLAEHGAVKRPATFKKKLSPKVKNVTNSWGGINRLGIPTITISLSYHSVGGWYTEYARIAKDDEIGSFWSNNSMHHLQAVVAHEVAHAADYWDGDASSHGSEWRRRYRILRRHFGLVSL